MNTINQRTLLRSLHLIAAVLIPPFIYSPSQQASEVYASVLQYGVLPLVIISGLSMWLLPRWRRRGAQHANARSA